MKTNIENSGPFLTETSGGFTVKYRNRYLYSSQTPKAGAERRASKMPLSSGFIYLLPSPLLYYGVEILIERMPKDSCLILLESDSALKSLSINFLEKNYPGTDIESIPVFSSEVSLLTCLDKMKDFSFRHVEIISLSGGYSLGSTEYKGWKEAVFNFIQTFWRNRATLIQMGRLWVDNLFENLQELPSSVPVSKLKTTKPIVVTGAGESLEHSLKEIIRQRADIFLLTVDTALPVLLEAGIVPDTVLALEGQHANIYDFFPSGGRDLPLICDLTVSPSLLHQYRGSVSFLLSKFDRISLFTKIKEKGIEIPEIPPLGSVGIAALHTALALTGNRVYFTGLDFSFRAGKSHSRSAPAINHKLLTSRRTDSMVDFSHGFAPPVQKIEGKGGKPLLTTPNLKGYAGLIDYLSGNSRLMDLRKTGLLLSVPETKTIISDCINAEVCSETSFSDFGREVLPTPEMITVFLYGEIEGLSEIIEKGYSWLKGTRTRESCEIFRKLINKRDYLIVSFPDRNISGILPESYVKRVLAHAARLRTRIQERLS